MLQAEPSAVAPGRRPRAGSSPSSLGTTGSAVTITPDARWGCPRAGPAAYRVESRRPKAARRVPGFADDLLGGPDWTTRPSRTKGEFVGEGQASRGSWVTRTVIPSKSARRAARACRTVGRLSGRGPRAARREAAREGGWPARGEGDPLGLAVGELVGTASVEGVGGGRGGRARGVRCRHARVGARPAAAGVRRRHCPGRTGGEEQVVGGEQTDRTLLRGRSVSGVAQVVSVHGDVAVVKVGRPARACRIVRLAGAIWGPGSPECGRARR